MGPYNGTPRRQRQNREPRPRHRPNQRGVDTGISLVDTSGTVEMARKSACQSASGGRTVIIQLYPSRLYPQWMHPGPRRHHRAREIEEFEIKTHLPPGFCT